ncbi:MAG TPA: SDR family oxidoreductase [Burkholderiales bacterium]|jgi:NAD(P)-dependent dehydrogenase (short-subunit alcohol dehydrogenase family)|nr:SDR family oxidoreductase [Burkholderiales bacterium]
MKTFQDRVAVVTGGASGLGRAMAQRFARAGMKIVLADVQADALESTRAEFERAGTPVLAVRTDVSRAADVKALADKAYKAFGAVHVLCNNAGVAPGGTIWELSEKDWEWVLGVNVWGVIHGIREFVPRMIAQDSEGCIVNTASVAGLLSPPGMGSYCVSKHSVVTMTECLHQDLVAAGSKLRAAVLCPAYVPTGIADSERNRPALLREERKKSETDRQREERLRHAVQSGRISAEQVADIVYQAVENERFYILPHQKIKPAIETRMQDILLERTPTDTFTRR